MIVITIIGILTWIFSCFGSVLMIGVAHYEKYGQDPQKRSFQDRLFSFSCLQWALQSFIRASILEFRVLFGPIGSFATLFFYFNNSVALSIPMGFAESILFKCLLGFFWKKFAAIDDDYLATFFNIFNLLIVGSMISIIRLMNGEFYLRYDYGIFSGDKISELDKFK